MVDRETIDRAAGMLRQAAPGATVILFGSHARGEPGPDSDVDFLVVEPQVRAMRAEMVRLRDVLRPLRIPVDVLVIDAESYRKWSGTPGTIAYEAATEGQVFDAVA